MSSSGKMVLLVEDNEDNRIVYSTILKHFGYEVTEALNGEEGIAKARSEKPDLILMDISIPIIDGWEATQVLKHDPSTKSIPRKGPVPSGTGWALAVATQPFWGSLRNGISSNGTKDSSQALSGSAPCRGIVPLPRLRRGSCPTSCQPIRPSRSA